MSGADLVQTQRVRDLKQKLHQSFLQISEVEKIYEGEIEAQKEAYETRIQQINKENQRLVRRVDQLERKSSSRDLFFLDGLEETKLQIQLDQISDPFAQQHSIVQLLRKGALKSRSQQLFDLESLIRKCIKYLSSDLEQYFKIAKAISQENHVLRDQLYAIDQKLQSQTRKMEDSNRLSQQLFRVSTKLKEDNKKLAEMYKEQLEKNHSSSIKTDTTPRSCQGQSKPKGWKDFLAVPTLKTKGSMPAEVNNSKTQFKKIVRKHASYNQGSDV